MEGFRSLPYFGTTFIDALCSLALNLSAVMLVVRLSCDASLSGEWVGDGEEDGVVIGGENLNVGGL